MRLGGRAQLVCPSNRTRHVLKRPAAIRRPWVTLTSAEPHAKGAGRSKHHSVRQRMCWRPRCNLCQWVQADGGNRAGRLAPARQRTEIINTRIRRSHRDDSHEDSDHSYASLTVAAHARRCLTSISVISQRPMFRCIRLTVKSRYYNSDVWLALWLLTIAAQRPSRICRWI
jgi:hypothetical protein